MTPKTKIVLLRFARTTAAVLVAALIGFLLGPDAVGFIPANLAFLVTGLAIPVLTASEKWLRYGGDPDESTSPTS